jgi:hypothetical protein
MTRYVFAQVKSAHVRGQLLVNGCTVWQVWDARATVSRTPLGPYTVATRNEISLQLRDAAPPAAGPKAQEEPFLELELGWGAPWSPGEDYSPIVTSPGPTRTRSSVPSR